MIQARRLPTGGLIDREATLYFSFNGRLLEGYAGDSLASALLANNISTVARSFKYHRSRGILSAGLEEPNALISCNYNGVIVPNLKATEDTWLPDAHVEAPTAGSVILAAILLKMAGYGFIRFSIPFFPVASEYFTPLIFSLSLIAIIYTSLVALMQDDMKKLIAYSSVAHMGYVTLGIFTFSKQGIEGSIFQMISHGLISAALFLCVGVLYDRLNSRVISTYGGVVSHMPKYSFLFIIFVLAALGLPGTTGFLGEFLVLMGAFQKSYIVAMIASIGVILGAAYMLWLAKRVIFGEVTNSKIRELKDLNFIELSILLILAAAVLIFGFYPQPIIDTMKLSVDNLIFNYQLDLIYHLKNK